LLLMVLYEFRILKQSMTRALISDFIGSGNELEMSV
jgi:hypothetical protein